MIIDEADEHMFRDLKAFYNGTKSDKVHVICLTATAYDGNDDGLQRKVIRELGYKVYRNSDKNEYFDPVIHERVLIDDLGKYRTLILSQSELCGVLVYATG